MDFNEYLVGQDDAGRRLDKILKALGAKINLKENTNIYSALRKGLIKLNGAKAQASFHPQKGDIISIASFLQTNKSNARLSKNIEGELKVKDELKTIFKNDDIWIINKPYNVSVQPPSKEKSIAEIVKELYTKDDSLSFIPAPLHRLDKRTTGILVTSQSLRGAKYFSSLMKDRLLTKIYIGLAEGTLCTRETWVDSISNQGAFNTFYTTKIQDATNEEDSVKISKAITHAHPLAYGFIKTKENKEIPVTLVQYKIDTGKKHQIRIQTATHGYPLLGDSAYNRKKIKLNGEEFFLHAYYMSFPKDNPLNIPHEIYAPLPLEFTKILQSALIKWNGKLII